MPSKTIKQLRAEGVPEADIQAGLEFQRAQRRAGAHVLSLAVIVGAAKPPVRQMRREFTERLLEGVGDLAQAAVLIDQAALAAPSKKSAARLRSVSQTLKEVDRANQLEFDFFEGNVSTAFQYQDAVTERLFSAASTPTKAKEALAVLWQICRHLGWQSYECTKTAAELCELTHTDKSNMTRVLDLLEDVGAITRVKKGRSKLITVTPEGAYRGDVRKHAQAVDRYKLEVIEGGKRDDD